MTVLRECPMCDFPEPLIIRTNKANGRQFLGCSQWPECEYTEPLPEDMRMRRDPRARELPGMKAP